MLNINKKMKVFGAEYFSNQHYLIHICIVISIFFFHFFSNSHFRNFLKWDTQKMLAILIWCAKCKFNFFQTRCWETTLNTWQSCSRNLMQLKIGAWNFMKLVKSWQKKNKTNFWKVNSKIFFRFTFWPLSTILILLLYKFK